MRGAMIESSFDATDARFDRLNPPSDATTADQQQIVVPFLKWAGGKRWLASHLRELIGEVKGNYIEPFLGSAAVFFAVQPQSAVLSDRNRELVGAYRALQIQHKAVERYLAEHQKQHCETHYYKVRNSIPDTFAKRAARFIYLNRTCWNGLYRVNLNGHFNVPIGTKTTVVMETDDFMRISEVLRCANISHSDFQIPVSQAKAGDVVFCDPPYTVRHNRNGFVKYNEDLFSWADQIRLRDTLRVARDRGARIFVTNANHESVRDLYCSDFEIREFERYSSIGGANAVRGNYSELLITG